MTNFYNEIDKDAADWLEELIRQGEIPFGVVDRRDIRDIRPDELHGYTQCHFFAGIGGWPLALRLAGWPDDRPVWTGSCPCQPFSTAGRGDGFADERHLWPHWHHLIQECGTDVVFGEQVAGQDGLAWLDLVFSDLEGTGYAVGTTDLCAAGVGSPQIRQRLWIGAVRVADGGSVRRLAGDRPGSGFAKESRGRETTPERERLWSEPCSDSSLYDWLVHRLGAGLEGLSGDGDNARGRSVETRSVATAGQSGGLADRDSEQREERLSGRGEGDGPQGSGQAEQPSGLRGAGDLDDRERPRPTNGFWRDADWLFCRDELWRPVEPSTFPLADGIPARVGLLRGYGNAINPWAGKVFIEAFCEVAGIPLDATGMGALTLNCHI